MTDNTKAYIAYDLMRDKKNSELVESLIDEAIEEGSISALYIRGVIEYDNNKFQEAYSFFRAHFKKGGTECLPFLADLMKCKTIKTENDFETELYYLNKGYEAGSTLCTRWLAFYYNEKSDDKNREKLFLECMRKLINNGPKGNNQFTYDCVYLADHLMEIQHRNEDPDYSYIIELLSKAAEKGNPGALSRLGCLYLYGTGVKKDVETAVRYLHDAAIQGNIPALEDITRINLRGTKGYKKNVALARYYGELGIKKKSKKCLFLVAKSYLQEDISPDNIEIVKDLMFETLPKIAMKKDKTETEEMINDLKDLYQNDIFWANVDEFLKEKHLIRYWL